MNSSLPHLPQDITAESPCIGHCSTVMGDEVCRGCSRTFDEVIRWVGMSDDERRDVNRRIAMEQWEQSARKST
ncbi:MAG: DUF1289 domain-containing protein [Gammaproteobacteria bacterium]|nr:DUF1289 domain-containing protein [Gammaproteobacteria bacterium]MBU1624511.1 DUF1289 domain-containing protein [Gammaproteobacteria bacterium]MBU1982355.1 DUF1289 domain-containing protein [Gammaproteobacteria bacterium]